MAVIRLDLDNKPHLQDWLHGKKKSKKTKEAMEPFKPTDGDKLQKPRVETVPEHQAHPRGKRKRMNPSGYGDNKREEI